MLTNSFYADLAKLLREHSLEPATFSQLVDLSKVKEICDAFDTSSSDCPIRPLEESLTLWHVGRMTLDHFRVNYKFDSGVYYANAKLFLINTEDKQKIEVGLTDVQRVHEYPEIHVSKTNRKQKRSHKYVKVKLGASLGVYCKRVSGTTKLAEALQEDIWDDKYWKFRSSDLYSRTD